MKKSKKITKTGSAVTIGIGLCVCVLCLMLFSAVMASLVSHGKIGEEALIVGVPALLFMTSNIGCVTAGRVGEGRSVVLCALTAGAFLTVLFCGGVLFFDLDSKRGWVNAVAILVSVLTATVLLSRGKRKRHSR